MGMERSFIIKDHKISAFKDEVGKYLYSLFVALKSVSADYIRYTHHFTNLTDERSKSEISHVERVFAYEFYRQWCDHKYIKHNSNIVINAEVPKQLIDEYYNNGKHLFYPDMVLHSGQRDSCNNLIICEIKRKEYVESCKKELIEDFKKLHVYLGNDTKVEDELPKWEPFKLGVFIMIVKELKDEQQLSVEIIKNNLKEEIKNIPEEITKKIICVVYDGTDLKYDTLYNMLNNK